MIIGDIQCNSRLSEHVTSAVSDAPCCAPTRVRTPISEARNLAARIPPAFSSSAVHHDASGLVVLVVWYPATEQPSAMRSILITGCNRGLGLGLVRHLIDSPKPPNYIFATCRDASKATELRALANKSSAVQIIEIDLMDTDSYKRIVDTVNEKINGVGLNVLFNNAAIGSKFTRLGLVKKQQITDSFLINTVAPIMLTKAFLPLLKTAAKNSEDKTGLSVRRAAVINMTSILGSIAENGDGGFYPYRCSKAALNAATKSMSVDLKADGILVACLHPGWVRTDLGGSNAPMNVDNSVSYILNTLNSLTEKQTGCFVQYDGKILSW